MRERYRLRLWQLSSPLGQTQRATEVSKWQAPSPGWVKKNADAAFFASDSNGATACVIRDHTGAFAGAMARWHEQVLDACTMEGMACLQGLRLAVQAGYPQMQLETDCLEVVQLWRRRTNLHSIVSHILEEIAELSRVLHDFSFSYVDRTCNKVAHIY